MPGNLLFADTVLPSVTGDTEKDIKRLLNHIYMLQEELRYTMGNLTGENFNEAGLADLTNFFTKSLSVTVQSVSDSVVTLEGTSNSQGATLELLAGYTGHDAVETISSWNPSGKNTAKTYYTEDTKKYYKYNGSAWVACNNMSEAIFTLTAINGQSEINMSADRIGLLADTVVFATEAGLSAGTTEISGGCLKTKTVYADCLATVADELNFPFIALQAGISFRDEVYMLFKSSTEYTPMSRSVQGVHSIAFCGDTVLSVTGGDEGNEPTPQTGLIRNVQSGTSTVTQLGMEILSKRDIRIVAQSEGDITGVSGVILYNREPSELTTGQTYFRLEVVDAGIIASKWEKQSDGSFSSLGSSTILS